MHVCMHIICGCYTAVQLEGVYFAFTSRDMGGPEDITITTRYHLLGVPNKVCLNVVRTTGTLAHGKLGYFQYYVIIASIIYDYAGTVIYYTINMSAHLHMVHINYIMYIKWRKEYFYMHCVYNIIYMRQREREDIPSLQV